jgi:hypothetical protein
MPRIRSEAAVYDHYDTAASFQIGNPDPGSRRKANMGRGKRAGDRRKPARKPFPGLGSAKKEGNQ